VSAFASPKVRQIPYLALPCGRFFPFREGTPTWSLSEPSGTKLAEITTKSGAKKIADLLNRAESTGRTRSK
jgi:hypothetical protein